jgi:cob(I)alamin adenosyltransferase
MIRDPETSGMILCDELNIVLRYDYLDINEVVDFAQE